MTRVQKWIQLWRTERVELTRRRARFRARPVDPDGRFVVGRIHPGHRVRAYGGRVGWENSFVPLLDAHLAPADDGCRLSGTLGWARWVRVQSAGGIVLAVVWTLGSAVGLVLHVRGPFVPFLCIGAVFTALGVLLPGWAGRAGWRDSGFLLGWLHERLQVR